MNLLLSWRRHCCNADCVHARVQIREIHSFMTRNSMRNRSKVKMQDEVTSKWKKTNKYNYQKYCEQRENWQLFRYVKIFVTSSDNLSVYF